MAQFETEQMINNTYFKNSIKIIFLYITTPMYLIFLSFTLFVEKDSIFRTFSQILSLAPGKTGIYIRAAFYRLACKNTSDRISIGFLTVFSHHDTTISEGVYIGPQCNIGKCSIGKNTLIGSGVHIISGTRQHFFSDINTPIQDQEGYYEKVSIGEDCWIGNKSLIAKNVADKTIVAAASIVISEFPPMTIVGGHPAKVIKDRDIR